MNAKNLEILGLSEGATTEEIKAAYERLREKYLEERFKDGEVGNNAARMLTRIETAYNELMSEVSENANLGEGGDSFDRVEEYLRDGNIQEAQRVLDGFNERGAHWHYLQSIVFYRKNWINESKKQLEIAIQLDPTNQKYKEDYRKLNDKINYDANQSAQSQYQYQNSNNGYQGAYQGQGMSNDIMDDQMGGSFCANCMECIACNMLLNCFCNGCCR